MSVIPPHNDDAEKSFLSAIYQDTTVLYDNDIVASDFYHESHKEIFEALRAEAETSKNVDLISLSSRLEDRKTLKKVVGGITYLSKVVASEFTASHAKKHAKLIKDASKSRHLMKMCYDTLASVEARNKPSKILTEMELGFTNIIQDTLQYQGYKEMKEMTSSTYDMIVACNDGDNGVIGIPSGFSYLDKLITGFKKEQLIILAARPGVGKSALALNIAYNIAKTDRHVGIVSLEMSTDELVTRLLATASKFKGQDLKNGNLSDEQIGELGQHIDRLNELKICVDDSPTSTWSAIKSKSRQLKRLNKLDILIVDYLQLITLGEGNNKKKYEEVTEISRNFKMLAKELQIPIILLSQLSRQIEQRTGSDKEPKLSDLRDSGAIEADANIVMMLERKVSSDDPDEIKEAKLYVRKNRGGSCGIVDMDFSPETVTFSNPNYSKRVYITPEKDFTEKRNRGTMDTIPKQHKLI